MALLSFRTRNPNRDQDTDAARFATLATTLDRLTGEVDSESRGLNARYLRVSSDAAFSLQAMENDGGARISARVDELTNSMARCKQRLASLEEQMGLLNSLRDSVRQFLDRKNRGAAP